SVVLARCPNIKFGFEQCQRHGHAVTGNGFGYTDNIRSDAGFFEAKECSGASTTGLNVVDNKQNIMVASQTTQLLYHSARAALSPPSPWTVSTIMAAGLSTPEPESSSTRSSHKKSGVSPSK